MVHNPIAVVQAWIEARRKGDVETMMSLMDEAIVFGTTEGTASSVETMLAKPWDDTDTTTWAESGWNLREATRHRFTFGRDGMRNETPILHTVVVQQSSDALRVVLDVVETAWPSDRNPLSSCVPGEAHACACAQ